MNPCIPHHNVLCALIYLRVKYPLWFFVCYVCSPCCTAGRIKNCSKSTSVIKVATMKSIMVPRTPVIVWNRSIHCPSLSAIFDLLHSSTNQELFEKYLCNKGSHYEKYGRFLVAQRKPSHTTTKLMPFTVWMEYKGGHRTCTVACQKTPLGLKRHQTVKKSSR